jgi:hypothetical protein
MFPELRLASRVVRGPAALTENTAAAKNALGVLKRRKVWFVCLGFAQLLSRRGMS